MSEDNLPTVWEYKPHTQKKHEILKGYLQAWMPILSQQADRRSGPTEVLYVDAFAGPGRYLGGEPGSPLVAIKVANTHDKDFPLPIRLAFIEKNKERWQLLCNELDSYIDHPPRNALVNRPLCAAAEDALPGLLENPGYRPTLVFLDQFGYSAVSMDLVSKILQNPSWEIFSFMNWRDLNHYLTDETKWPGIDRAFGGTEWREVIPMQGIERSTEFLRRYDEALKNQGGATFSCSFAMHDKHDQLLYWLIFCSNSDRGLEEMKKAMWKVDSRGNFKFSDKHSGQLNFLGGFDDEWLALELLDTLHGQELTVAQLRHHVLTETPCHSYANALAKLEKEGHLRVQGAPSGRRLGSFKSFLEDSRVKLAFERVPTQTGLF